LTRTFFLHIEENSPLIKLHPLLKISFLITVNVLPWIIDMPLLLVIMLMCLLALYKIMRIPLKRLCKFIVLSIVIIQAIMFSYIFGSKIPGRIVYVSFPWGTYVSDKTLLYAITVTLRFLNMLIGSTMILAVLRDIDIIYGFLYLKIPYSIAFTISLALRSATIFIDDYFRIRDAMVLRGVNFDKGNIVTRARNYSRLAMPLMVLGVRRMIELGYILEVKGLGDVKKRTFLYEFPLRPIDVALLMFMVCLVVVTVVLKYFLQVIRFPGWPFS